MIRIGQRIENSNYTKRFASYVIIEDVFTKKIAIATECKTFFFLGGGIENDETEIEALKREVLEESGYELTNIKYLDKITAWADGGDRGLLDVTATFYTATFGSKVMEPIEKDHKVLWVYPDEYKDKLFHEFQRYILLEYLKKR